MAATTGGLSPLTLATPAISLMSTTTGMPTTTMHPTRGSARLSDSRKCLIPGNYCGAEYRVGLFRQKTRALFKFSWKEEITVPREAGKYMP